MWFVYIIKCVDNSLYTGYTNNLEKRFEKHKLGKGSKYIRSHKPEKIIYSERHIKKLIALRREREIKKLTHKDKVKFIESKNLPG